jgi:hypothetical protein
MTTAEITSIEYRGQTQQSLFCYNSWDYFMNKADSKAIARKLLQITSKEARFLLRTAARLDAYSVTELYADWMTVNYRERYDIFSPRSILFKHGIPLRRLKSVTRKFTDSGDTIKHGSWMSWSLAIWQ